MPKKFDKHEWDAIKTQHGGKFAHHTEKMEKALKKHDSKLGRQFAALQTAIACAYDEYTANGFDGLRTGMQTVLDNWDTWMAGIEDGIAA